MTPWSVLTTRSRRRRPEGKRRRRTGSCPFAGCSASDDPALAPQLCRVCGFQFLASIHHPSMYFTVPHRRTSSTQGLPFWKWIPRMLGSLLQVPWLPAATDQEPLFRGLVPAVQDPLPSSRSDSPQLLFWSDPRGVNNNAPSGLPSQF